MSAKRDFLETVHTPGWAEYEDRVKKAIANARIDLSGIETDGRSAEQIGADHIRIEARIAGLERALDIAEDIKNEDADDI